MPMPSQTSVQFVTKSASSANQFIESIGVDTHLAYNSSPYANTNQVVADLNYLGIHAIRDQLYTTTLATTNINALATLGYKFDFEVTVESDSTVNVAKFMQNLDSFQTKYPGSITAIEGPNEVNTWMVSYNGVLSIASAAEIQKQIYTAAKADPLLKNIPVYNVTIGSTDSSQFAQLGNLSNYTDYANSHAYVMSTTNISAGLDYLLAFAAIPAPGKPMVITEAGYTTLPSYWYDGVSEIVQAKYTLTTLLDAYQKGVAKTYLYELIDDSAIPSTSLEAHFGLFNADGSPKLAAMAIHNLTKILSDTGSAGGSLSYALSGMPPTSHDMVLAKSDGSKDIVLWAEPVLWNQSTQSAVTSTPSTVTVTFDRTEALVKLHDPLLGSGPIATYTNVSSIQVAISDHPVVIEVVPAANSTTSQTYVSGILATEMTTYSAGSPDLLDFRTYDTAGSLTSDTVVHADRSKDLYFYGVKNQDYVNEHDTFNAGGALTSTIRVHADGSLASTYSLANDGTTTTEQYDSAGIIEWKNAVRPDGSYDMKTYKTGTLSTEWITYSPGSADAFAFDIYSVGVLTTHQVLHADKSQDVYYYGVQSQDYVTEHDVYNSAGLLSSTTRTHADGSLAYSYSLAADGTRTTDQYDAAGLLKSHAVLNTDGSSDFKSYLSGVITSEKLNYAPGSADVFSFDIYLAGVLTSRYVLHSDNSQDVYDTNVVGKTYVADHFHYDGSGGLTVSDLTNADGSHTVTAYTPGQSLTSTTSVTDNFTSANAGSSNFIFNPNSGNDTITGFHAGSAANHDTITVDPSVVSDYSHLVLQQANSDTLVKLDANDTILIKNMAPSALTAMDFQFVHHDVLLT
jgi:trimeric autotransporter adhesin